MPVRGHKNPVPTKPKPGKVFTGPSGVDAPHKDVQKYAKTVHKSKKPASDNASRRHLKHYGKAY